MLLTEKFFRALGWKKRLGTFDDKKYWMDAKPHSNKYRLTNLPPIETDFNAFFKWVKDEMLLRKFKMVLSNNPGGSHYHVYFIDTRLPLKGQSVCGEFNRDFRIAGIESAIKILKFHI